MGTKAVDHGDNIEAVAEIDDQVIAVAQSNDSCRINRLAEDDAVDDARTVGLLND